MRESRSNYMVTPCVVPLRKNGEEGSPYHFGDQDWCLIGSADELCNIVVGSKKVARCHALITGSTSDPDSWELTALDKNLPTVIGHGRSIRENEKETLKDGTEFIVGDKTFRFELSKSDLTESSLQNSNELPQVLRYESSVRNIHTTLNNKSANDRVVHRQDTGKSSAHKAHIRNAFARRESVPSLTSASNSKNVQKKDKIGHRSSLPSKSTQSKQHTNRDNSSSDSNQESAREERSQVLSVPNPDSSDVSQLEPSTKASTREEPTAAENLVSATKISHREKPGPESTRKTQICAELRRANCNILRTNQEAYEDKEPSDISASAGDREHSGETVADTTPEYKKSLITSHASSENHAEQAKENRNASNAKSVVIAPSKQSRLRLPRESNSKHANCWLTPQRVINHSNSRTIGPPKRAQTDSKTKRATRLVDDDVDASVVRRAPFTPKRCKVRYDAANNLSRSPIEHQRLTPRRVPLEKRVGSNLGRASPYTQTTRKSVSKQISRSDFVRSIDSCDPQNNNGCIQDETKIIRVQSSPMSPPGTKYVSGGLGVFSMSRTETVPNIPVSPPVQKRRRAMSMPSQSSPLPVKSSLKSFATAVKPLVSRNVRFSKALLENGSHYSAHAELSTSTEHQRLSPLQQRTAMHPEVIENVDSRAVKRDLWRSNDLDENSHESLEPCASSCHIVNLTIDSDVETFGKHLSDLENTGGNKSYAKDSMSQQDPLQGDTMTTKTTILKRDTSCEKPVKSASGANEVSCGKNVSSSRRGTRRHGTRRHGTRRHGMIHHLPDMEERYDAGCPEASAVKSDADPSIRKVFSADEEGNDSSETVVSCKELLASQGKKHERLPLLTKVCGFASAFANYQRNQTLSGSLTHEDVETNLTGTELSINDSSGCEDSESDSCSSASAGGSSSNQPKVSAFLSSETVKSLSAANSTPSQDSSANEMPELSVNASDSKKAPLRRQSMLGWALSGALGIAASPVRAVLKRFSTSGDSPADAGSNRDACLSPSNEFSPDSCQNSVELENSMDQIQEQVDDSVLARDTCETETFGRNSATDGNQSNDALSATADGTSVSSSPRESPSADNNDWKRSRQGIASDIECNFESWTVKELREYLLGLDIKCSGLRKAELVQLARDSVSNIKRASTRENVCNVGYAEDKHEERVPQHQPGSLDFSGYTVKDLKKELTDLGLDTSGRKQELIARLENALRNLASDETGSNHDSDLPDFVSNPENNPENNAENTELFCSPQPETKSEEPYCSPLAERSEYKLMTVRALRRELQQRGLAIIGLKSELVQRLAESDNASDQLSDSVASVNLQVPSPTDCAAEYMSQTVVELRKQLKKLGLQTAGKKVELVQRLVHHMHVTPA